MRCHPFIALALLGTACEPIIYGESQTASTTDADSLGADGDGTQGADDDDPPPRLTVDLTESCSSSTTSRGSPGTYIAADGTMQVAAANTPRCDHDAASGAARGLLLERSSRNEIANADATGGSASALPTGWEDFVPSGLQMSYAVADEATFGRRRVRITGANPSGPNDLGAVVAFSDLQGIAVNEGETWTVSVYVRLASGSLSETCGGVGLHLYDSGGNSLAGVSASANGLAPYSSAYRRDSVTYTVQAGVAFLAPRFAFYCLNQGASFVVDLVAPQLERGALATSYIPTSGTPATRAAETWSYAVSGNDAKLGHATAFAVAEVSTIGAAGFALAFESDDGSDFARIAALATNRAQLELDVDQSATPTQGTLDAAPSPWRFGLTFDVSGTTTQAHAAANTLLVGPSSTTGVFEPARLTVSPQDGALRLRVVSYVPIAASGAELVAGTSP